MVNKEVSDLIGVGKIIDSDIAKETYKDALSPAMKEIGGLTKDSLKALRLFTAPIQLLAAYQDRYSNFCDRVSKKVPEEYQKPATANIAKPVMEAFAFTEDDSPLMDMFEELMSKAIDTREADKLNPVFPDLIKNLSPLQAVLIKELNLSPQVTDDVIIMSENRIIQRLYSNFSFDDYSDHVHHLTLIQDLKNKNIVNINVNANIEPSDRYSNLELDPGCHVKRTKITLSMFGKWFSNSCVRK